MCAKGLAKFILVIFNIAFFILGAVVLAVGIYILTAKNHFLSMLEKVPEEQKEILDAINAPSLLENSAYGLIGAGAFIFLLSFFGCCGAIKEVRIFLILYAVIVSILMVVQIAMVIVTVAYKNKVEDQLKGFMRKTIAEHYNGAAVEKGKLKLPEDAISMAWDYVQLSAMCCGANGFKDYDDATQWQKNYTIMVNGKEQKVNTKIPITCCKLEEGSDINPDKLDKVKFVDIEGCIKNPSDENANKGGCYEAVKEDLEAYSRIALWVGLCTVLVELLGIIAACWLCRAHSEYKSV